MEFLVFSLLGGAVASWLTVKHRKASQKRRRWLSELKEFADDPLAPVTKVSVPGGQIIGMLGRTSLHNRHAFVLACELRRHPWPPFLLTNYPASRKATRLPRMGNLGLSKGFHLYGLDDDLVRFILDKSVQNILVRANGFLEIECSVSTLICRFDEDSQDNVGTQVDLMKRLLFSHSGIGKPRDVLGLEVLKRLGSGKYRQIPRKTLRLAARFPLLELDKGSRLVVGPRPAIVGEPHWVTMVRVDGVLEHGTNALRWPPRKENVLGQKYPDPRGLVFEHGGQIFFQFPGICRDVAQVRAALGLIKELKMARSAIYR